MRGVVPAARDAILAPNAKGKVRGRMLFDLDARRCAGVAGLLRPSGLFCRVLALPAFFLIDTSLCRYPLDIIFTTIKYHIRYVSCNTWIFYSITKYIIEIM